MARLFRLFLAGYLVTALVPRGTAAPPQSDISQIEQLIRQLGSTNFRERQAASQALGAIGVPAARATPPGNQG